MSPNPHPHPPVKPLARKQTSDHADWLVAWQAARDHLDTTRANSLLNTAAQRITSRLRNVDRAAYGWSGGKDSLALALACERAGVTDCCLVISGLEWPAFLAWCTDNMPWGLAVECRSQLNMEWLLDHQDWLFPQTATAAAKWFRTVQHAGQRAYASTHNTQVLLLGRRLSDGNYCGPETAYGHEYLDRGSFVRYSPIADWSHEDVLTVLAATHTDLPPCYAWPRGFRVGTGPWPARQWTATTANGWDEVTTIDPSVTEYAASAGLRGAATALVRHR